MTDKVEEQVPSEEEQPPVTPAPVSEEEDAQLSQQDSQDVVSREDFNKLAAELRGVQGKTDKLEHRLSTEFEKTAQDIGVELTEAQKQELRFRRLEAAQVVKEPEVTGEEQVNADTAITPEIQQIIDKTVSEQLRLAPTGASAVAPGGGSTPSQISIEEAADELTELQTKPRSTWTKAEQDRAAEIMKRYEEEVDK